MIYKDDWRLKRQRRYIEGLTLRWKTFTPYRKEMDSDHCEFCWAKFATKPAPDVLTEGYTTDSYYYWICKNCFEDFKEMFEWKTAAS
jgi:Pyruvate/2-oxoacid:ferredoxin oxidoreductase delta subunit